MKQMQIVIALESNVALKITIVGCDCLEIKQFLGTTFVDFFLTRRHQFSSWPVPALRVVTTASLPGPAET